MSHSKPRERQRAISQTNSRNIARGLDRLLINYSTSNSVRLELRAPELRTFRGELQRPVHSL